MEDPSELDQSESVAPFPRFSFNDLQLGLEPTTRARRAEVPPPAEPAAVGLLLAEPIEPVVVADDEVLPPAAADPPSAAQPQSDLQSARAAVVDPPPLAHVEPASEHADVDELVAAVAGPPPEPVETKSMVELRALLTSLREPMGPFGQYEQPTSGPVDVTTSALATPPPQPAPVTPSPIAAAPPPLPPAASPPARPEAAPPSPPPSSPPPASPPAPPVVASPAPVQAPAPQDAPTALAAVPDAVADVSTEVPRILVHETSAPTPAAVRAAAEPAGMPVAVVVASTAAMPALSQAPLFTPQRTPAPRPVAPLIIAPTTSAVRKRRKGGALRALFSLIVVLGLLGGAAFAAKRYILDIGAWDDGVKAVADDVAEMRGLDFKNPVVVVHLPVDEYSRRLTNEALGLAFAEQPSRAPELRAMGLLQGELDVVDLGETAMIDMPAFYSPTDRKILIADVAGLGPATQRFALSRALAQALLDQHFGWSTKIAESTSSVAFGIRAMVDADALSVAASMLPNAASAAIVTDQLNLVQQYGYITNSPYLAAVAGRAGVVMAPTFHGIRADPAAADALVKTAITSDGAVLDLVRGLTSQTVDPATGTGETMGLAYWYYVLAGRLDDQQAWLAATSWAGDTTTVSSNTGGVCVSSTIAAYTDGGAGAIKAAFDSWAAAGPLEARATVQQLENNRIAIMSCDPGAAAVTMAEGLPIAFGGAPVERALVSTVVPDPSEAVGAPVCLVLQARFRNVPYSLPDDQSPLLGMAGGWQAPYVTANVDLGGTCLAPQSAAPVPEG